jgi:hypothetical protein
MMERERRRWFFSGGFQAVFGGFRRFLECGCFLECGDLSPLLTGKFISPPEGVAARGGVAVFEGAAAVGAGG